MGKQQGWVEKKYIFFFFLKRNNAGKLQFGVLNEGGGEIKFISSIHASGL